MKDYRLTVKVRNNRILKAIEESGSRQGIKWCDANGLSYTTVNDLINMTTSPLTAAGDLTSTASKLCDLLGKIPEDLWSNEQLYPLERNFSEMEMDHAQIVAMLPHEQQSYLPDFSAIDQEEAKSLIDSALSVLTEREQKIIRMRYYEDMTLDECAKHFGVTRERARQIEQHGMRKLRHPLISNKLIDALDIDATEHGEWKKELEKYSDTHK